jgi:hypothetical protein
VIKSGQVYEPGGLGLVLGLTNWTGRDQDRTWPVTLEMLRGTELGAEEIMDMLGLPLRKYY